MAATNIQSFSGDIEVASNLAVSNINFTGVFNKDGVEFKESPWTFSGDHLTYTTGNVAIGTNNTDSKLTVGGSMRLTDELSNTVNVSVTTRLSVLLEAKLVGNDTVAEDILGSSVSLSNDGNTALVMASNHDTVATNSGAAYVFARSGGAWSQQAKITASDGALGDQFGMNGVISGDGNTIAIGAFRDDETYSNSGSVYVFTRSGSSWSQQDKLVSSTPQAEALFGRRCDLSDDGNVLVVGAYYEDEGANANEGAVYMFRRTSGTWDSGTRKVASDGAQGDFFGLGVAVSGDGDTVLIGSYYKDGARGNQAGAAYVFTWSGSQWNQQAKLEASNQAADQFFGIVTALSQDGNTALIGAYNENTGGNDSGAAYVFVRSGSTWSEQAMLLHADVEAGDQLGSAVSLSSDGNKALVGNRYDDGIDGINSGSSYIFVRSGTTWTEQTKVFPDGLDASDTFGYDVAISGDGNTALVGAYYDDDREATNKGDNSGAAYVFDLSERPALQVDKTLRLTDGLSNIVDMSVSTNLVWTERESLTANVVTAGDVYGWATALSGDGRIAAVGAYTNDDLAENSGALYVYVRAGKNAWSLQTKLLCPGGVGVSFLDALLIFPRMVAQ